MNIDHLRYFLVLAQEMHYGRAAQRLNISQSGLSHAMGALEAELGAPLFSKNGRGIQLGRYGELLLPEAQRIIANAESLRRSFQMVQQGVGVIRVQTIPLLIVPTVTRLCRQFRAEAPGCDFSFSTGMSLSVCQSLSAGEADIGFFSNPGGCGDLDYAPLLRRRLVVLVPLDHPLAGRESLTLAETLPYPHVTYSYLSGQREPTDLLFAPYKEQWQIAYEVEDANFIAELVAQGFGISVMIESPPAFHPGVKRIPLSDPEAAYTFYIARRKPPHPLPSVDAFYEFCLKHGQEWDVAGYESP